MSRESRFETNPKESGSRRGRIGEEKRPVEWSSGNFNYVLEEVVVRGKILRRSIDPILAGKYNQILSRDSLVYRPFSILWSQLHKEDTDVLIHKTRWRRGNEETVSFEEGLSETNVRSSLCFP